MDKNRKLLIAILALFILCLIVAVFDMTLHVQDTENTNTAALSGFAVKPKFGPGIGVVRVSGPIEMSSVNQLGMKSGAEAVISRLDVLAANPNIRAIVLRINSPGGTVAATQEIYQKLWQLRKRNIPLIASMGDIAASGGYYIASACNIIYANHGTMTGSIGVIAYSPNIKRLFDKLGIRMDVIKSGKYKDIMSSYRDISEEERLLLKNIIDSSYKRFVSDVALGRNVGIDEIMPYADGRIMTGEMAKEYKLVDELGGFEDAIIKAKKITSLHDDAPVYEESTNPLQQLFLNLEASFSGAKLVEKVSGADDFYRFEYRYVQ